MEPKMLEISVSQGSVIAYDFGGDGPHLIVLHANGFHARAYTPMVSLLRGYHVYSLDFRGHGRSPLGSAPLSLALFADDVACTLRTLRIDRCYAFGHSLGGVVALACAVNHPTLFTGLFLFEPVICAPAYSPTYALSFPPRPLSPIPRSIELEAGTELLASIAERRKSSFASRAAAAANLRAKQPYAAFDPLAWDAYLTHGLHVDADCTVRLACAPATEAAVFRFAAREAVATVFHRLGAVRVATVIACGADTGEQFMWLPEGSKQAADALGDHGRHVQFAELEHMGPMTHPALLAQHIKLCFAAVECATWDLLPPRLVVVAAPPRL